MDLNVTKYEVTLTFITPLLGSQPQKDVASEYLARRYVDNGGILPDDKLELLPEIIEKGTTVFHRDGKDNPILFDYQIKGFLKEAGMTFNGLDGVKAMRSKIDKYVFITPRQIALTVPGEIAYLERPLRAETAQGPRVALARSEMIAAGATMKFFVEIYDSSPITSDILRGLLSYGSRKGLGQWRNGGYGRFEFVIQ